MYRRPIPYEPGPERSPVEPEREPVPATCPHCGEPDTPIGRVPWARRAVPVLDDLQSAPPLDQLWTAWRTEMEMQALVWGKGSPESPFNVLIRARIPDRPGWFPAWFDCCDLLHQLADAGTIFQATPFETQKSGPALILEQLAAGGWSGIQFVQIGVRPGSTAHTKAGILHRPNLRGNHGRPI